MPLLLCTYIVAIFDDYKGYKKILRIEHFFGNFFGPPLRHRTMPRPPMNVTITPPPPPRRAAFFETRGAPPPPRIDRCAAADTVMSAHGSTRTKPSGQKPPGQTPTAGAPGPRRRRIFETGGASTPTKIDRRAAANPMT